LFQLREFSIDSGHQILIDGKMLIGRLCIRTCDRAGESGQFVIESDREVEWILAALILCLVKLLFDLSQLFAE